MKNWQTTLMGLFTIVGSAFGMYKSYKSGDANGMMASGAGLSTGAGLILARDASAPTDVAPK